MPPKKGAKKPAVKSAAAEKAAAVKAAKAKQDKEDQLAKAQAEAAAQEAVPVKSEAEEQKQPVIEEKKETVIPEQVQPAAPAQTSVPEDLITKEVEQPVETAAKDDTLIFLGDKDTAEQQGVTEVAAAAQPVAIGELSLQERKELRKQRFNSQGAGAGAGAGTTLEALAKVQENKQKLIERAERFGIVTKEINQKRIKERQERFGIETKESVEAKKDERRKRFAQMDQAAEAGLNPEQLDEKKRARLERFGQVEEEEPKQQKQSGGGQKRKQKFQGKFGGGQKGGKFQKGGNKNKAGNGNENKQKRFKSR